MPQGHRVSDNREASEMDLPDREVECRLNDLRSFVLLQFQGEKKSQTSWRYQRATENNKKRLAGRLGTIKTSNSAPAAIPGTSSNAPCVAL